MDISALREFISQPSYNAMSDEECAAALNVASVAVQGDVTKSRYILWLAANNGFAIIEQAKAFTHVMPEIQAGVRAAGTAASAILNAADVPVINTGDPQVAQLFGLFQQVGLLSAEAVESFMANGRSMKTPLEFIGWPGNPLTPAEVAQVRAS
jgi:hypothetical protein